MVKRFTHSATCPNGHVTTQSYTLLEWAQGLRNGQIIFHCSCGQLWSPKPEERDSILAEVAASEQARRS